MEPEFFNFFKGIDSKESIPPAHVAWHADTTTLFLLYAIALKFQHSPRWLFFEFPYTYIVMSTIPKRKYKRSDIEANYRNETKTF
jgi:hypothetical protein